jgi:F0F1-type ATP synthase assembly protein I
MSESLQVAQQLPSDGTGSVMDFIAGLVVGFVIGFMLALFLFSWLTAVSEGENEP